MKNSVSKTISKLILAAVIAFGVKDSVHAQGKRVPASLGREEYVEVEKNVRLHVTDLGEGKPVVLIHGWPLSNAMYEYQYQYLVRKGFRVIGISLRGFGKSDKPYGRYDFDVFSDDIKVVLEKLKIEDAVLGGFSMGGAVVIHYVTKYNAAHVGKLALFAAAAPTWKQREGAPYGVPEADAINLINETMKNRQDLIAGFGKDFPAREGAISQNIVKWLENMNLEASPYATTESIRSLLNLDLRRELSKIKIPTVIFSAVHDKLVSLSAGEALKKGIANAHLVRFENSGHALFFEEADKFNAELEKFARQ
ncbi:alpha/beta fold hydrolase [Pedobacter faecalis]|uniref:alpha/beta fold hydrolase n=1 Tax=Pedobacter faecalis TaxID=3041495 RepID=UPI00254B0E84|nr:alpha/beta hydrolase [Pedobacter sp. ELA7]